MDELSIFAPPKEASDGKIVVGLRVFPTQWNGWYHPVHLDDLYDDGRYRISWVALRILMAEQPSSIEENITCCHDILAHHDQDEGDPRFITYKRHFHIDGPNGRHLCLVLPFCGPNLHSLSNYMNSRMKPQFVQALAYQATEIIRDLHARGICHGNIRPGNLLLRIRNLDHLGDQGIYRLGEDNLLNELSLIGFDHAFQISSSKTVEPLTEFLVPEVAIRKPASPASDVWALGVTILNMRSGISLFPRHCVKYFGELPTSWEEPFYDEQGRPTSDKTAGRTRDVSAIHENTKRPYPKHYANRGWKPSAAKIIGTYLSEDNPKSLPRILTQEAEMLYNLLREIFVYEERINAEDILGHTWFGIV
ncbi:kinase-like domain-containing protein [Fusarium oxysporum]|nr:kinase-like domain-containing protein [Fusarium oxysporum]